MNLSEVEIEIEAIRTTVRKASIMLYPNKIEALKVIEHTQENKNFEPKKKLK